MEFLTVRELTASPKTVWRQLDHEGEIAITNKGKPTALLLKIPEGKFDETMRMVRQVKSMQLLNSIWAETRERNPVSEEEIEEEIRAVKTERV